MQQRWIPGRARGPRGPLYRSPQNWPLDLLFADNPGLPDAPSNATPEQVGRLEIREVGDFPVE